MSKRIGAACIAAAAFAALGAQPACADVLEIAPDGAVTTYAGAMVHTDAGATAIVQPASPPPGQTSGYVRIAIAGAAHRYGLRRDLVEAVAWQESRLRHAAVSPKGAVGVMQLTPATARDLGVDPRDLEQNVAGGAAYLARLLRRYNGDLELSLAAYNAGPGAVDRHGGVPPYRETQAYVAAILRRLGRSPR